MSWIWLFVQYSLITFFLYSTLYTNRWIVSQVSCYATDVLVTLKSNLNFMLSSRNVFSLLSHRNTVPRWFWQFKGNSFRPESENSFWVGTYFFFRLSQCDKFSVCKALWAHSLGCAVMQMLKHLRNFICKKMQKIRGQILMTFKSLSAFG